MKRYLFIILILFCVQAVPAPRNAIRFDTAHTVIKRAADQKEQEVFADKDFIYKADVKESKNWLKAFIEWLSEQLFGKVGAANVELTWQIVKWTAIGLFVAGIIFVLWKSKFRGLLRSDPKSLAGASFADLPEDLESVNIDKHIDDAMRSGNYRLAIRWCFLKSLQLLDQKKQIAWKPSKTNVDYQYELKNADLRERFSKLSYVFEYVWYGELNTTEGTFANYRNEIERFNSSLHG